MRRLSFALPYPPSVNHYWRMFRGRMVVSIAGRRYRHAVAASAASSKVAGLRLSGRLSVVLRVSPPDKRRRDLDNVLKALLDGLQAAAVYEDDAQVDELRVLREGVDPSGAGRVFVAIEEGADA
jgi:crossover junction endodeoxyribonuclease RusA